MDKKTITFGDTKTEEHKFHCLKNAILIYYVDINKW